MWEGVQAVEHSVNASADPLGHPTLSLQLLWEAIPSEVGHEEAHLHSHG
jgi:hypothetical protein